MKTVLISPANASFWGTPTVIFSVLIPVIGVTVFTYIMAKRLTPLISASPDNRFDRIANRTLNSGWGNGGNPGTCGREFCTF